MRVTASLRAILTTVATAGVVLATTAVPAAAGNVVTPGNLTGYGFDQCLAPSQSAMTTWMNTSPFLAVGIYISGDSRACTSQPNLTPSWISTQLAAGWRLLPITLGPQASCTTRERYLRQVRISPDSTNGYAKAAGQGRNEADKTVAETQRLGISSGSTLWYDIEAFDTSGTNCRESALTFLSAWTKRLHERGYVSGIYSSAASGIKILDDARVLRPGKYAMPDQIWIADWNGRADVYSSYVRNDGWMPHKRVHQYRGGHNETHGGVTINIDSNWLDVGRGSWVAAERSHCGGVSYNYPSYPTLTRGTSASQVKALQCMLRNKKLYTGTINGRYGAATIRAARAYMAQRGLPVQDKWTHAAWIRLLVQGKQPVLKFGSAGNTVRRLQRGLNAAGVSQLSITGIATQPTVAAIKRYQAARGLTQYGVMSPGTWSQLDAGRY